MGRFAIDKVTPAVDLKLLINSESGKQTVLYPKGERIASVDFTSALSGNQNRYPFDRYSSGIDLLVTVPEPAQSGSAKAIPEVPTDSEMDPLATTLVVSPNDLNKNETVPINESFSASTTSLKFDGQIRRDDSYNLMRTSIAMRRANSVIFVSLLVMSAAVVLSISIMGMALQVIASRDTMNLLPLSLCITLIFGLPALRNIQPGVPAMGAVCDYLSFIWAELIVTTSAIGLAWTWITRTFKTQKTSDGV